MAWSIEPEPRRLWVFGAPQVRWHPPGDQGNTAGQGEARREIDEDPPSCARAAPVHPGQSGRAQFQRWGRAGSSVGPRRRPRPRRGRFLRPAATALVTAGPRRSGPAGSVDPVASSFIQAPSFSRGVRWRPGSALRCGPTLRRKLPPGRPRPQVALSAVAVQEMVALSSWL